MDTVGAPETTPVQEAAERVEAYFRALGLADLGVLDRSVQETLDRARPQAAGRQHAPRGDLATNSAMDEVEAWLEALAARLPEHEDNARALLWLYLPGLLKAHPQAFMQREGLPQEFEAALRQAARGVVPERVRSHMAPQEFGRMPRRLQKGYWVQFGRRVVMALKRAASTLMGR